VNGPGRLREGSLRLVAVTDSLRDGIDGLTSRVQDAVAGGATMVTLRLPGEPARVLADVARALLGAVPEVPLLVSGRVDVALAVNAAGAHLGADDLPVGVVRRFAPGGFIIGVSIGSADDVARGTGADFAAVGPVFSATRVGTSPSDESLGTAGFATLVQLCALPVVAIGGVSPANARSLTAAGAAGVAVISALVGASDPMGAARALRASLDASER
jgi:thiamine-phosphate pyrophosphorylase